MKDLVISAIANYLPEKIKIYVESLNDCGFDGDKIMICYNLPNETIEYLASFANSLTTLTKCGNLNFL